MKFNKTFLLFAAAAFISLGVLSGCGGKNQSSAESDKLREYAGDLINRGLYKQAVAVYEQYLASNKVDDKERANVNYIIANTYFDRLNDYESSLAYYLKIKHFYPETGLMGEVNKKIVACLERLDRSQDAQQALDETVQLDPSKVTPQRPGEVIAEIGDRKITQGDLDYEISKLPPSVRNQVTTKEQKRDFLREYVATELLYDTAQRAGLDKDPEVIEGAFQAKRSLMVQKLLQDRVAGKVEIEPSDVELYYQANKDKYAEKDAQGNVIREVTLSEVRDKVTQDLTRSKFQGAYEGLIEKMFLAEGTKFYENRVQ
jgi:tetratricopeptide (TPR) repeat protein